MCPPLLGKPSMVPGVISTMRGIPTMPPQLGGDPRLAALGCPLPWGVANAHSSSTTAPQGPWWAKWLWVCHKQITQQMVFSHILCE